MPPLTTSLTRALALTPTTREQYDLLKRARRYLREASPETRLHLAAEVKQLLREAGATIRVRRWRPVSGFGPRWRAQAQVLLEGHSVYTWDLTDRRLLADAVWEDLIVGYLVTSDKEQENGKVV